MCFTVFPQVGAEKELRTVIEGESLFNDGSAYVLFLLFRVSPYWCLGCLVPMLSLQVQAQY